MNQEYLRIIYKYEPKINPIDLWITLCHLLEQEGLLSEKYEFDDEVPKTISQIEKILRTKTYFSINDDLLSFSFGAPWVGKLQQFIVTQEQYVKINWDLWIKELSVFGEFVYAWQADKEFSFWQNQRQIESYKRHFKPYKHLPMKESGEPLPLPQIVIDISKNPGRNVWKPGYVETIGSTMWFGDEFFSLTGSNKEVIKSTDWLQTSELKPGILKIKAQDMCFTESEGMEAELQNKMRDLLYPNHD